MENVTNEFKITDEHTVEMRKFQRGDMRKYVLNNAGEVVAKECSKCRLLKVTDEYSVERKAKDGKRPECKACIKKKNLKWREQNPDKFRENFNNWYKMNREKDNENSRKWRQMNKEKCKNTMRKWQQTNAEKACLHVQRRKARKQALPDTLTPKQLTEMLELQNNKCLLSDSTELHLEHFIPLSWNCGGTTFENCYYMDAGLNISKGNKNPFEWIATQPEDVQNRFYDVLIPMLAERNGMDVVEFETYVHECEMKYLKQVLKEQTQQAS